MRWSPLDEGRRRRRPEARSSPAGRSARAAARTRKTASRPPRSIGHDAASRPHGGLIAIGGPPLAGKNLLATRLVEWLPRAVKLETVDDLSRAGEHWYPYGPAGPAVARPTPRMLNVAREIWRKRVAAAPPTIVLCARFETSGERRQAARAAARAGLRFLFVEARSSHLRALRRVPALLLPEPELIRRMERYQDALTRYQPMSREELKSLPGLRLGEVITKLEPSVRRVLLAWTEA